MSLKLKTIYGFVWNAADAIFVKGLTFLVMLILARWLGPAEFGLIGMIAVFIAMGRALVDSGMTSSLIRAQETNSLDYTSVFYANLGMSTLVYAILYVLAPFIANFYNQEILVDVIRVYCLIFVLSALSAVQLALITKHMEFKKLVLFNMPSTILGALIGLLLAYKGYGVWSIVFMHITTQILLTILLWINSSWKPNFAFSKEKFGFHYNFGYKLMLSTLIDTVFKNSYNVIIGKFFPIQTLGHYERAQRFNDYPSVTLTGVIDKVTYPMLSKLQDNKSKLSEVYARLLQLTFFLMAPLMLGGAAISRPLFEMVLGEQWLPAVPFFKILSLAALLYPVHAFNLNILKVYGRSDLFLKLELLKKAFLALGIVVGFQFGIYGLVWSSVFASVFSLLINTFYSGSMMAYSTKNQLMDMVPILLLTGLLFLVMSYSINLMQDYSNLTQISVALAVGVLFYFTIGFLFKLRPMVHLLTIIKTRKL